MKAKTKTIFVEAVQVTDEWFTGEHPNPLHPERVVIDPKAETVTVDTVFGKKLIRSGDWIIETINGGRSVMNYEEFHSHYDLIAEPEELITDQFDKEIDFIMSEEYCGSDKSDCDKAYDERQGGVDCNKCRIIALLKLFSEQIIILHEREKSGPLQCDNCKRKTYSLMGGLCSDCWNSAVKGGRSEKSEGKKG